MKFIKNCIKLSKPIILIIVSVIIKEIFFKLNMAHAISKKTGIMDALIISLLFFSISLITDKKNRLAVYIIDILVSLILFANVIFYRVYGDFITYGILQEIGQVKSVSGSVFSLIYIKDIIYFIDLPVLYFILFNDKERNRVKLKEKLFCFALSIFMCICFLKFLNYRNPFLTTTMISRSDLFNGYGLLGMYTVDTASYIKNNKAIEPISVDNKKNIEDNIKTSIAKESKYKKKNLVLIQVESLEEFVINKTYEGKEITPNINKFIKESSFYNNCYYQIGLGHTSDAELLSNTSLYPAKDNAVFMTKYNNKFYSLSEVMKKEGYNTLAFHGNDGTFWNRNIMFNNFGFDTFYDIKKLKNDETIQLVLSDISLFKQSAEILKKEKQPFYSFIITTTSHSPFDINSEFCETDTNIKKYYNAMNYVDKSIGIFLDKLKEDSLMDNSIVIIYGDHNGITLDQKSGLFYEVNEKMNSNSSWQKYQKVPLIIRYPKEENKGVFYNSIGQIDIMPTILDIFGIGDVKYLGDSAVPNKNNLVVFRSGSFILGNKFYDASVKETYDITNNNKVKNDNSLIENSLKKLKASDDILKYNYYKNN